MIDPQNGWLVAKTFSLPLQLNMAAKKALKVVDIAVVPVSASNIDYEGIPETPRAHITAVSISRPNFPAEFPSRARLPFVDATPASEVYSV